jgi:hypothetical protein
MLSLLRSCRGRTIAFQQLIKLAFAASQLSRKNNRVFISRGAMPDAE